MDYTMEELIPVVSWLTEKYTHKDSTSVSYEAAEMLMEAVIYCIRQAEETAAPSHGRVDSPDSRQMDSQACPPGWQPAKRKEADWALWEEKGRKRPDSIIVAGTKGCLNAERLYHEGYELVIKKTMQAKHLYEEILADFQDYGNRAYSETIVKGLPQFFLWYDARFRPQDHLLLLDYPVLMSLEDLKGVERIFSYLECVHLEQRFLGRLMEENVREILFGFHEGYKNLLVNVSAVVWRSLIGRMMAGKEGNGPDFTKEELECVEALVKERTDMELKQWITELNKSLIHRFYGGDQQLASYLELDLPDFVTELKRDTEYGCLERLFPRR